MWIDVAIILILCICSAIGFKMGLLPSLFSIATFFLSIYLTYKLLPITTNALLNVIKVDKLQSTLVQNNSLISWFINNDNVLIMFIKKLLHINETTLFETIVEFICNICVFVLLSVFISRLLKLLTKKISCAVKKLAIIGSFDRLCGLLFGFLKGIVIVAILCFVLGGLNDLDTFKPIFSIQIESSSLYSAFKVGSEQIIKTMINLLN